MATKGSGTSKASSKRAQPTTSSPPSDDPIKHIVVLALENRPFDQMLGALKAIYPAMEGVDPAHPSENTSLSGEVYRQRPMSQTITLADPKHNHEAVMQQ